MVEQAANQNLTMNRLPPDLFKQFQEALCDAFPRRAALMQMARFGLDENLDEVAGGETLRDLTFNLIQYAESHGKLQKLLDGALTENPSNPKLIAFNATWKAQAELGRSLTVEAAAAPPNLNRKRRNSATSQTEHGRSLQPSAFAYDVFLSHSSADKPTVRDIAEMLRDAGLTVWFDEWIIQPGDSMPRKIQQGLQESRMLLLCMSDNALTSDWAQLENHTFLFSAPANEARRFMPLLLDDCIILDMLAQFLYIDWRDPNDATQSKLIDSCQPATQENPIPLKPDAPEPTEPKAQPIDSITIDPPKNRKSKTANQKPVLSSVEASLLVNVFGSGPINAVALTLDEKQIVTGADDGLVRLWDRETLTCTKIMVGHQARVWSVAVTDDGKRIISGSSDRTVKVWDLVAARCDRGGFTVSNAAVQNYCDKRGYVAHLQTSAKTGDGCNGLMNAIAANIPWDRLPKTSTTLIFKTLKDGLLKIRETDTVLMHVAELQQRLQLALPDLHFSESGTTTAQTA